jgi:hypothetical protein
VAPEPEATVVAPEVIPPTEAAAPTSPAPAEPATQEPPAPEPATQEPPAPSNSEVAVPTDAPTAVVNDAVGGGAPPNAPTNLPLLIIGVAVMAMIGGLRWRDIPHS